MDNDYQEFTERMTSFDISLDSDGDKPPLEDLVHYGVKGMKWGVRKDRESYADRVHRESAGSDKISVTTKHGEKITVEKERLWKSALIVGRLARTAPENYGSTMKIVDSSGKKVGSFQIWRDTEHKNTVRGEWLEVDKSAQGKGYSKAAIQGLIDSARNDPNVKHARLQVPTDAAAAKHIYTELGFRKDRDLGFAPGFGNLEDWVVDLDKTNVRHSQEDFNIYTFGESVMRSVKQLLESDAFRSENFDDSLQHYGVKGMKWGVRKDSRGPAGVHPKTNREARKDAKEFTKAKMFYGEGAGTRRKLIKATVEAKSKRDPSYKKAFDYHVQSTDMSNRARQARSARKRKDVSNSVRKTGRGVGHILKGNSQYANVTATLAVGGYMYARKTGIDKVVGNAAKTLVNDIQAGAMPSKAAIRFLGDLGVKR